MLTKKRVLTSKIVHHFITKYYLYTIYPIKNIYVTLSDILCETSWEGHCHISYTALCIICYQNIIILQKFFSIKPPGRAAAPLPLHPRWHYRSSFPRNLHHCFNLCCLHRISYNEHLISLPDRPTSTRDVLITHEPYFFAGKETYYSSNSIFTLNIITSFNPRILFLSPQPQEVLRLEICGLGLDFVNSSLCLGLRLVTPGLYFGSWSRGLWSWSRI